METLKIQIENKKDLKSVIDFLKKLGVSFEREKTEEKSTYNPEFVKQVLQARQEILEGKYHKYTLDELKEICK